MTPVGGIHELRRDPDAVSRPAHAPLNHVSGTERAANIAHVHGFPAKRECGVACDHREFAETGELGDHILRHAVTEIDLLGIAAHVLEWQNRNRRLVGTEARRQRGRRAGKDHPVSSDGARDVLQPLLTRILETDIEFAREMVVRGARDQYASWRAQLLQTGRDVDPVTQEPAGAPVPPILPPVDGFLFLDKDKFAASFAADVDADVASFTADLQVPWGVEALTGAVTDPAWKSKPSYYLVASEDRMIPPAAQRMMAGRAGSTVTETAGSHAVYDRSPNLSLHSSSRLRQASERGHVSPEAPIGAWVYGMAVSLRSKPRRAKARAGRPRRWAACAACLISRVHGR